MGCFFCFRVPLLSTITTLEIDNLKKDKKMDGGCGSVSMDRYWNMVATPLLFIVIGIGLFIIFRLNGIDTASTSRVLRTVGEMGRRMPDDDDDDDDDKPGVVLPALSAWAGRAKAAVAARKGAAPPTVKPVAGPVRGPLNVKGSVNARAAAAGAAFQQVPRGLARPKGPVSAIGRAGAQAIVAAPAPANVAARPPPAGP